MFKRKQYLIIKSVLIKTMLIVWCLLSEINVLKVVLFVQHLIIQKSLINVILLIRCLISKKLSKEILSK